MPQAGRWNSTCCEEGSRCANVRRSRRTRQHNRRQIVGERHGGQEVYLAEDPRTLGPVALGSDDYAAWGASAAR